MQNEGEARAAAARVRARGAQLLKLFVFIVFSAIAVAQAGPVRAADYTFGAIKVTGLQRIDEASLMTFAAIPRGKPVSDADLNAAYQRIANSGLFETVTLTPEGSTLLIAVKEYPTINVINFEGNKRIKSEDLAKIVKSQSRHIYSPTQAEADAAAITEAYRQSKRFAVEVTPKIIPRSENRVDLVFEISEGQTVEIQRLTIIGNHAFSEHRLRQVLATKQAGFLHGFFKNNTFDPNRIDQDKQLLTDFYQSRGYIDFRVLDANAQLDRSRNAFYLTFMVQEGQQYRIAKTSASTDLKEIDLKAFQDQIHIRPGEVYSPTTINDAALRMEDLATSKGLNFIRVTPKITRNDRDLTLDVDFVIDRGPKIFVERIDIEGNSTTLDRVIRRQFHVSEGDPLNPRQIKAASDRIKALGYFKDVQVTTKPGDAPDQAIVDTNVTEQPTGSLSLGGTYGVNSGFGLAISFSEKNFLGRGQNVDVSINTTSDNRSSTLSFTEPALFGRDLAFSISGGYVTSTHSYATYDTRIANFSPSLEFPVSPRGRLALRYGIAHNALHNIDSDTSTVITSERTSDTASTLGYTYSFDTSRTRIDPKTSFRFTAGQDFAGLGGTDHYVASTGLVSAQTKVAHESVTLRAQLEGGVLTMLQNQDSTVLNRYFLNGKIIGFEPNGLGPRDTTAGGNNALGGNYYAVARLEAEFPLGISEDYGLTGGVFMNAGSVWGLNNTNGTGGTVDDSFHLRSTVGVSLFWHSPIGPLRFDFSKAIKKMPYDRTQAFDMSLSTTF